MQEVLEQHCSRLNVKPIVLGSFFKDNVLNITNYHLEAGQIEAIALTLNVRLIIN